MKPVTMAWTALLIATHAAAYFAMADHSRNDAVAEAGQASMEAAVSSKVRERGERNGDASHKALLRELLDSDLPKEDFEAALDALLVDWIKRDLRGALDLFFLPASPSLCCSRIGDSKLVSAELDKELARQSEAVWSWICSGRYGSNRVEITRLWNDALMSDGQRDLLLASLSEGTRDGQAHAAILLCARGSAEELDRIRELLGGSLQDHNDYGDLLNLYTARRTCLAGGDVQKLLAGESDPEMREDLCKAWAARELEGLTPAQIAERLESLPVELFAPALSALDITLADRIGGMVELIEETGRRGLWKHLDEEARKDAMESLFYEAHEDFMEPSEIVSRLQGISDPRLRAVTLDCFGGQLAREDASDGRLELIASLPAGADRDEFLSGFILQLKEGDSQVEEAFGLLHDPSKRTGLSEQREEKSRIEKEQTRKWIEAVEADTAGE